MQDELYGGARGRAPKGPTAKEKADELKTKIRNNDADFLEKYMQYGYEKTRFGKTVKIGNNYANILDIVRSHMDQQLRTSGYLGILYSDEVAKTVTRDNVIVWLRRNNERLVKERREDADRMEREQREEAERKEKEKREAAERNESVKQEKGHRSKQGVECQAEGGDH